MAYEYNLQSARFELPNPHRVENIFLGICALLCVAAGAIALLDARASLVTAWGTFYRSLVFGAALLGAGLSYTLLVMRQLRFFFGRGQPADLVPHLELGEQGYRTAAAGPERQLRDAAALREAMQQNAITYRPLRGPIDNLLYSLIKDLVYSPEATQRLVRVQFQNLLGLAFLALCFGVSQVGLHNSAASAWIGCVYFVLALVLVLRPFAAGRAASARLSQRAVVAFIVGAVVGPVLLARTIPPHAYPFGNALPFATLTVVIVTAALATTLLLLLAGIGDTVRPDRIAAAPHLETPSVNAAPAQIFTELAREMQRLWIDDIPNRTYMRTLPDTSQARGSFTCHLLEKTQPEPQDTEPLTAARAFALATTRWLTVVDLLSTVLTGIAVALIVRSLSAAKDYADPLYGGALLTLAAYGIRSANGFWRRFEFKSKLYWVECSGYYSRASTAAGALLSDRIRTERELINVETMTLRVWTAELDSVAFDTDGTRDMVSLRGLPNEAQRIGKHLATFGEAQATIVVPSAGADRERLGILGGLNANDVPTVPMPRLATPSRPDLPGAVRPAAPLLPRYCSACGSALGQPDAPYCAACGHRLRA